MKGVLPQDRPREKLVRSGATALGDNELVALLVGEGTRTRGALMIAQELLDAAGGVRGLSRLGLDELRRVPGIGTARAARLLAGVELGRRAVTRAAGDRPRIVSTAEAARYLAPHFSQHREERFGALMLDTKSRLIRAETLSVGTLDAAHAHPREVFRAATLASASTVVLFHNHPSGDPAPSADDLALTERLVAAGELMGIAVVDHIILGDGCWFSFREACML